jgi:transcriptional regulator with XRE-family HTH domain
LSLASARKNAGLTQHELAELLSISQSAVALWESGKSHPRVATLLELSSLYGVTVDELLRKDTHE